MKKIFFLLLLMGHAYSNMPRLLIKIPTRSRPTQLLRHLAIYYQKLSGTTDCHFLIMCNTDDATMNNEQMIQELGQYKNLTVRFADCKNKIDAYNQHIEEFKDTFDILVVASDDMIPVKQGYDRIIADYMHAYFPDYDGTLHFFDGHVSQATNTMPIIGKKYYDRFGYIYYPQYQSMYCDNEFTIVAKILKKEIYIPELIIEHLAPAWGKAHLDDLYRTNNAAALCNQDSTLFAQRQTSFFALDIAAIEQASTKLWSILIYTIPEQQEHFMQLCANLKQQIDTLGLQDQIEIINFVDDHEYSIGYQRNDLLARSHGKYISFIDAKDNISTDYISAIHEHLVQNPDLVFFKMFEQDKFCFYPIRRAIAIQFPFLDQNFQHEWVNQVINSHLVQKIAKTARCYSLQNHTSPSPITAPLTVIDQDRLERFYQSSCATMSSIYHTYNLAYWCIKNNIPGDFVECGVLNGGHAATMGWATYHLQSPTTIHLIDPVCGIDQTAAQAIPTEYTQDDEQLLKIKQNMQWCKSARNNFNFHFGPYQLVVPAIADSIAAISFLRLHSNTYQTTKLCLEFLYQKISHDGYIMIDNYYFYEECQRAVTEFLTQHDLHPAIKRVQGGNGAAYWQINARS